MAIDLNAVPPLGIDGVEMGDKGQQRDGVICYGAIGVGDTKMKIHKAASPSCLKAAIKSSTRKKCTPWEPDFDPRPLLVVMNLARFPSHWHAPLAAIAVTVAVTCLALGVLMRWDRLRRDVPFEYNGDSLLMQMIVQTAMEQPWYLDTPRLGAPHGLSMYDYPCADTLDILLVKAVGLLKHGRRSCSTVCTCWATR